MLSLDDAASLIRLFWLLQHESLGNNYHKRFSGFFKEALFERYSEIWHLHKNYTANPEQKKSTKPLLLFRAYRWYSALRKP